MLRKKRILACAVDVGAWGALNPVTLLLVDSNYEVVWVVQKDSMADGQVSKRGYRVLDDSRQLADLVRSIQPDLVLAGVSSSSADITLHLSQIALDNNLPVVKVVDFWGTGHPHEKGFAPTRLCVLDEASRVYEAGQRNMNIGHIVATGAPQFDALINVNSIASTKFGGEKFILISSPSSIERVSELLECLFPALSQLDESFIIGMLCHPQLSSNESFTSALNSEFRALLGGRYLPDLKLRQLGTPGSLIKSADLVIGTTSTQLVMAAYLRKPVLSVVPEAGSNHKILTVRGIDKMPISVNGSSAHAGSAIEVKRFLDTFTQTQSNWILSDEGIRMSQAQEKHYSLDGLNADRVVKVIEELL